MKKEKDRADGKRRSGPVRINCQPGYAARCAGAAGLSRKSSMAFFIGVSSGGGLGAAGSEGEGLLFG
jgi:hypothetical protein